MAAQRPFYFEHIRELTDGAMDEYGKLTGRHYQRAMGYRLEDAEYVLAGMGSVVSNAEAVADYLRETRGLKVGVFNLTMFRPFPADLVTSMLRGKKAVTVLERLDQPLAVDPPVLREIRAAMGQAHENARATGRVRDDGRKPPFPHLAAVHADQMPDFYAGGFGFGSRDLQPGDLIAAVDNMLESGGNRRHFYLGIDFVRRDTRYPKLQIWQEQLLEGYPHLEEMALKPAADIPDLHPEGSISIRIHSVGGWGAITTGKNIALTAFELLGLHVKANPKYGSEKKGQPTNFYATLAPEPIRLNAELKHVNVVLSPDPNVFKNGDALAGLADEGVFVIQSEITSDELWASFPAEARHTIVEKRIKVYMLDGFKIASEEASDPDLRYRMQGAAFMGAFFAVSPLMEQHGLSEDDLFEGIEELMHKKFGGRGERVVQDNVRVIRRGFDELIEVPIGEVPVFEVAEASLPQIPISLDNPTAEQGFANPGRFWEQVCAFCQTTGEDGIADPFAAVAVIPAATSTVRDMSNIRFEVPHFVADKCTGCSRCWVQCPDAAIPGLVHSVEDIFDTAIRAAQNGRPLDRVRQISKHLARESRTIMKGVPFKTFGDVASSAYSNVMNKLGWTPEKRVTMDEEWAAVFPVLAEMPLAKTTPFFDLPERKEEGSGGILSITVNPEACKGCNICVDVCPEGALITVRQDEEILERLRRGWDVWNLMPDTDDRFINISDLDAGIGVLSSLLLKKKNYLSMVGGDGACMGCGEKTAVHILVSTIEGVMIPRVEAQVTRLGELIVGLDLEAKRLLADGAELDEVSLAGGEVPDLHLDDEARERLAVLTKAKKALEQLRWRYVEGPGGRGRAAMGISNSTGCSSVWGSTYPYNPYPFPWVNHLFQDAPSVAVGLFEGHMRKMSDGFADVRLARALLDGSYDAEQWESFVEAFDWESFTSEEFELCPPIIAMGGDGAMLDIGFQNLSRVLASGKPIRVVVLDTQVYSNTGGQSCTSGFTGQVADMAAYGSAQHGKTEARKELSLITMAHRGAYVMQASQALPSHMMEGLIKGLRTRRPAVFNIYTPCPVEHGTPDEWAPTAARMALESRAFPIMIFDPDAGDSLAECIDLDGNPAVDDVWPTYELSYVDDEGQEATMELPVTTGDWAATEGRFAKHFKRLSRDDWSDDMVPFHEFVAMSTDDRAAAVPFVWVLGDERRLERLQVSSEMVILADDRLAFWSQLKEMAGLEISERARDLVQESLEVEFEAKAGAIRTDYETKLQELKTTYPKIIARRMAEGLVRSGNGGRTVNEILAEAAATPGLEPVGPTGMSLDLGGVGIAVTEAPVLAVSTDVAGAAVAEPAGAGADESSVPTPEAGAAPVAADAADDTLAIEPYIDTELCTTCNECTDLNGKMFAYNANKQAYIKDVTAGKFSDLVKAAERCPAEIIHPGTPLNPKEKDLEKWIARAEKFN